MLAFMFPGQGSQNAGMALDLLERFSEEKRQADEILGYDLADLCRDEARLRDTKFTQPAVFVASHLAYRALIEDGERQPDLVLGHSLGLYAALCAAGVLDYPDALRLVDRRAAHMKVAGKGTMLAVIGAGKDELAQDLLAHDLTGIDIANDNGPEQIVLAGKPDDIDRAARILARDDRCCVPLAVSGAFHSRYQEPARLAFTEDVIAIKRRPARIPVVSTTSGGIVPDSHFVEELTFQLVRPVRWYDTVRHLRRSYPAIEWREVGPGRVLTGLVTAIERAEPLSERAA